jgi:hypothetical protein
MEAQQQLLCPACGHRDPSSERFCTACGMPLVHARGGEHVPSERQRQARKISPRYAEGELVQVAEARDLPQAEFIAGLLLEEGIPALVRSSTAGYSPMVGTREILVPESGAEAAREALSFRRPG